MIIVMLTAHIRKELFVLGEDDNSIKASFQKKNNDSTLGSEISPSSLNLFTS